MRNPTEVGKSRGVTSHKSTDSRVSLRTRLPLDRLLEAKMLNGRQQAEMSAALFPSRKLKVVR
jgi:hypothetical protein